MPSSRGRTILHVHQSTPVSSSGFENRTSLRVVNTSKSLAGIRSCSGRRKLLELGWTGWVAGLGDASRIEGKERVMAAGVDGTSSWAGVLAKLGALQAGLGMGSPTLPVLELVDKQHSLLARVEAHCQRCIEQKEHQRGMSLVDR